MEDNGILVKYAYSFLKLTQPNLGFITAHSSLITAQTGSVTPYFVFLCSRSVPNMCMLYDYMHSRLHSVAADL